MIAVERRIRSAWGSGQLVRNLPAALKRIRQLVPRGLLPLIGSLVIIIGFVAVSAGWAGDHGAGAGCPVRPDRAWRSSSGRCGGPERSSGPSCGCRRPSRPTPRSSPSTSPPPSERDYQVGMWLPYFLRIGRPFVIVTRTVPMLRQIDDAHRGGVDPVPIIFRPTLRSVEEVIVASMTTAFYVNNAARNTHFVERRELDARLAEPRRLGEAGLLQPGARDLRPDLRRGSGRHRPLRPARRAHSRRRSSGSSAGLRSS